MKREVIPNAYRRQGVMVGFIPNLRRPQFQNEKLRQALNLAFDFEELNRTTFFGQYQRVDSYFHGTELASKDLPQGRELEILTGLKDKLPPSVFTTPFANPVGGKPDLFRNNLRQALALLKEGGYELRGNKTVEAKSGAPVKLKSS